MITILDKFGRKDIILTTYTETTNSMGGIKTRTSVSTTLSTADLQFVNYQDRELLNEGYAKIGDGLFYTIYSDSINEEDEITVDSVIWILTKRVEAETIGTDRVSQAWVCTRKNT
jgi:hypothetical protein